LDFGSYSYLEGEDINLSIRCLDNEDYLIYTAVDSSIIVRIVK